MRTGVRLCAYKDPVFARMGNDKQLWAFTIGSDVFKDTPDRFDKEIT